jgi:L-iditol 2-dehydrogenase
MVQRFLPDAVVDPFADDLDDFVRGMTGGVGADIVVCANPVPATHAQAVQIVRKAGRVVLFGGLPKANPTTSFDGNVVHYGEIEVVGAFSYHPTFHAMALDLLARGVIPADLMITQRYPLEGVAEAFEMAASGDALKVLLTTKTYGESGDAA